MFAGPSHCISICPNRRGPRRFCGARLCEPQHVESDRRAGFVKALGGRQSSCGSQTRAPLVAAWPRCAVTPNCIRQNTGSDPRVGVSQRLAECNSAMQSATLGCDPKTHGRRGHARVFPFGGARRGWQKRFGDLSAQAKTSSAPREGTPPTIILRQSACVVGPVPAPGGFLDRLP